MKNTDRRNRLDDRMFHYRITKNNIVLIEYYGKQIMILKGNDAEKFLNKINHANNDKEQQLIMAKITGNFKREMNVIENESHFLF
ncbi:hypothetical protein COI51_16840 [Bacillus toyonensis]|uniref:hypothetical protein n=1 Tax=Bacillus toyonensis TaxID=155322 RepID=UPI000BF0B6F1|nr:hypothetical protein [Bacillus toyonensis]PEK40536.1 hypothetical protein CN586_26285 [Bacillus toyonensis]PEL46450.1 hypothetical protein CN638_27035 [Bacillus toyonensis]PEM15606.1 hypothetical protein CN616_21930 [Bacillus toyonensis]PEM38770.1 hypothetical protein CN636_27840 [Bacillus toyonensis]PFZ72955.1 hypothetical protein COL82_24760 [Bacillus toyonensis]